MEQLHSEERGDLPFNGGSPSRADTEAKEVRLMIAQLAQTYRVGSLPLVVGEVLIFVVVLLVIALWGSAFFSKRDEPNARILQSLGSVTKLVTGWKRTRRMRRRSRWHR